MNEKKMIKKTISVFIIMMLLLTGCGNRSNPLAKPSIRNTVIGTGKKVDEFLHPEAPPDFSGEWKDVNSGNCIAEITSAGGADYDIVIERNNDDQTVSVWEIKGTYYESTTLMEYTGAKYYIKNGEDEELVYEDGDGYFSMGDYGDIEWTSADKDIDGIESLLMEKTE
jgi:PBP1b-binding outer membrane lipoprotein LpoB